MKSSFVQQTIRIPTENGKPQTGVSMSVAEARKSQASYPWSIGRSTGMKGGILRPGIEMGSGMGWFGVESEGGIGDGNRWER